MQQGVVVIQLPWPVNPIATSVCDITATCTPEGLQQLYEFLELLRTVPDISSWQIMVGAKNFDWPALFALLNEALQELAAREDAVVV